MMINVLVTSVGGGVGQSVVDSISHLKGNYYIVGLDISDKVYARNQCDAFAVSPRIIEPNYIDYLLLQCVQYSIDILIPGHDGELELLSKNIDIFAAKGVCVVVSPAKIVASSRNKYNWYRDYSDIINIVPTALYDDFIVSPDKFPEIFFPIIAKPSAGSASSGIKIFLTLDELYQDRLPSEESINYVVQPYLLPKKEDSDYLILEKAVKEKRLLQISEISCQIVYDKKSTIMGIFVSRNSLKNGVPVTIEPVKDDSILSVVEDIAHKLKKENVVGPVNIQGRLTENGLVFFEMNLRFTGITGNRSQFGFNEVSAVINSFVNPGDSNIALSLNTSRVGARQVACTTSYPLNKRTASVILVTGASSWAAKNLVIYLCKNIDLLNTRVVLSCRDPEALKSFFRKKIDSKDSFRALSFIDVSDIELTKAIGLCDVVVNFVSARPPHGPNKIYQSTLFNLYLVELIKKGNPGLVINMSSQSVYEQEIGNIYSEESSTNPNTPYSISKLTIEHAFSTVRTFTRCTEVINLRLGRLWSGVDADKAQFPYRLLDTVLGNGKFTIDNQKNKLNMLDIDDLSYAVVKLISGWENGLNFPGIMNLGGINTSIEELLSSLEAFLDDKQFLRKPVYINNKDLGECSCIVSSALAESQGIVYKTELATSWKKMVDEYLTNKSQMA